MHKQSFLLSLLLAAALSCAAPSASAQATMKFRTIPLNIGIHMIQAEAAVSSAQRQQGLMYREKLGTNQGMVFLFESASGVCMWMKNTLIPLSAAFIDEEGRIVNIEDMQPQSLESHCAKKPAKYVLEMNQGWFARKNIKPGTLIEGLPR